MLPAPIPDHDARRVRALRTLRLLDSNPEERFDRCTRLAKHLFDTDFALVSLVDRDRQWFKSNQGLGATETPRDISFCGHAILGDEVFVVEDATKDERFADNPLVTGAPDIRFYAGYPIRNSIGLRLGTLCIIDRRSRPFTASDRKALADLGAMVDSEIAANERATTDSLTGLMNREGFDRVRALFDQDGTPVAAMLIDLDGFKAINDTLGHDVGDEALVLYARLLQLQCGLGDIVARLGGDEFVVVRPDATGQALATTRDALLSTLDEVNRQPGARYWLGMSGGLAERLPGESRPLADVLAAADEAMYEEKRRRKQQVA